MDENLRRWLVSELEQIRELERLRIRQRFQFSLRRLLVLMGLISVALAVWQVAPLAFERLMLFLLPNGLG